jgi:hypothetical protein
VLGFAFVILEEKISKFEAFLDAQVVGFHCMAVKFLLQSHRYLYCGSSLNAAVSCLLYFCMQVYIADPINKVALAPFLKEKLQTCAALHGEAAFNAAMSRLHPSLLLQLQQLMQP